MGYRWLPSTLITLRGIEPYEVMQALTCPVRRPVAAGSVTSAASVLSIWARTAAGRPLIVVVHRDDKFSSAIIGARCMSAVEEEDFQAWEASRPKARGSA